MSMEDKDNLILTAVGPDRIGLVEKISEFVLRHGCNIEDSKMAVFCGEFALILLVSGESQQLRKVADTSELAAQTGLNIWLKTPSKREPDLSSLPYKLTVSCMDHTGVVYRVSSILSRFGINIESMETNTHAAPVSGTPIFRLEAFVSVPTRVNVNALRARLEEFAREENIDFELSLTY
jgi:glycine cleavage system transcriptional repressor